VVSEIRVLAERSSVDGVSVEVSLQAPAPPWAPDDASQRVADAAVAVADRLGLDVACAVTGGAADANLLAAEGIQATVVNARFAKPLDAERLLALAARTPRMLTVEEHVAAGGFGSAVGELFDERGAKVELEILGVPDEWVDHGAQKLWRKHFGLDAEGIADAVRRRWPNLAGAPAERESAG